MGLKATQFANTNDNFATVTFNIVDGYLTVNKINATVTITGHNNTVDYDGKAHSADGYDAVASSDLYDVTKDFTYSGRAEAVRTTAGTTAMRLKVSQFTNINENFETVTFNITDGFVTINKANVTVTIVGNIDAVNYDGKEHTVSGYTATSGSELYDVNKDFTFSGNATVSGTNAGKYSMGLKAEQFTNTNDNFGNVVFNVIDGYITVNKINATVTITGHNSTVDYDGKAHSVSGYDAVASTDLYDATKDFTFSGNATASGTNAGKYSMGLKASQFANASNNFETVTFNVTDGYITVNKINATVTITGHNNTVDYDGKAHSVSGYDAVANTDLYDVTKDFTFSGNATVSGTNAGKYSMGLKADQFANTNTNFETVTFNVNGGYITVNKINATVTITGHNNTVDYDGKAHSADGYDAVASTDLYDVTKDFTYSGRDEAVRTNAGTTKMNLSADKFKNTNTNFANVTFNVTDGFLTVNPVDAVITTAPASANPIYNGSDLSMVKTGVVDGGTLYYAINQDPKNSPADSDFATTVPTAKETGSYYVWYKVKSDANHNDLSPVAVRVILAEKDWVKLNGSLYQSDGVTTVGDAVVTLMKGNQKIDYAITDKDGQYLFIVPTGVYSVVAEYQQNTQTAMVTLFADKIENTVLSGGKTESRLQVDSNGGSAFYVAVGGLDEEARAIRKDGNIPADTAKRRKHQRFCKKQSPDLL